MTTASVPAEEYSSSTASAREPVARDSRRRVPALDGVRGLAAITVMCYHFGRPEVSGSGGKIVGAITQFGWCGVDLFFVLSGFLITGILLDTRDRPAYFETFYRRRILRIFPLYFAFVALFMYVIAPRLPGPPADLVARQQWLWTYLANFDIARHGWYAGVGSNANNLWSLAIEEQFYLVFPLAVFLLSRRRVGALAIGCVFIAIASRIALAHAGYPSRMGYVLTFAHFDGLGCGALLAVLAREGNALDRLAPLARAVVPLSLCAVVAIAIHVGRFSLSDWTTLQYGLPSVAIGFAALLLLAVAPAGSPALRKLFESRLLRFFGLYSYGLYIWHPMVGGLVRRAGFDQRFVAGVLHSSSAAIIITVVGKIAAGTLIAVVSYHVLERPFLRLKDRRPRRKSEPQSEPRPAAVPAGPL